jgi:hypothetical protein
MMKKIVLSMAILFFAIFTSQAQLGGLLKKAKDKVTEKKDVKENPKEDSKSEITTTSEVETKNESNNKIKKNDPNTPDTYFLINNPLGKISFSNQPFSVSAANSKTKFASNENIYARLQLTSGTIKEALKISDKDAKHPFYNFEYVVVVYRNKKDRYNNEQIWNNCLLNDADLDKNYLDFDVLPSPDKATTIISALADFNAGKAAAPLYAAISPTVFSEDGVYKIDIIIRNPAIDNWGNVLPKDKWPTFEADFDFDFNSSDVAMLKKNKDLASSQAVDAAANAPRPLPKQWKEKSSPLAMGYTQAQLMALYESSFSSKFEPYNIIKFHASPSNGGWTVQNNEYGIPRYRYSNQWYTVFIQFKNGKKACFFQGFGLRQEYQGGGTYGKVFCDVNDSFHYADCAEMK